MAKRKTYRFRFQFELLTTDQEASWLAMTMEDAIVHHLFERGFWTKDRVPPKQGSFLNPPVERWLAEIIDD